jgi:hypothetical protein
MGILVPEANLPMGVVLNNVYMSFSDEMIYTNPQNGRYVVSTYYKVYKDQTKYPASNIRIPISCTVDSIKDLDAYTILYQELKTTYPGSIDIL